VLAAVEHFIGDVDVKLLPSGFWRLDHSIMYVSGRGGIRVPHGFVTDFASVPKLLWFIFPPTDPRYAEAAVLHDRLYEHHIMSRKDADGVLFEAARATGCTLWRAWCLWLGVRLGGHSSYVSGPARQIMRRVEALRYEKHALDARSRA
jgi:hypothetical protein